MIKNADRLPANGTVRVFIDDLVATNNVGSALGDTIQISNQDYQLNWDELIEGADFVTDYDSGIITINRNVLTSHVVGVRYTTSGGEGITPVSVPAPSAEGVGQSICSTPRSSAIQPAIQSR
jgi:hypothetical protein